MKILMVLTSHDQLGNTGRKTGFWLEELAAPYYTYNHKACVVTYTGCHHGGSSITGVAFYQGGSYPAAPLRRRPSRRLRTYAR